MKKIFKKIIIIVFWLLVWQLISINIGLNIVLPSPLNVLIALVELLSKDILYISVFNSFAKITAGFILAFLTAVILGMLSGHIRLAKEILSPLVYLMKTLPVAAFIILVLIWAGAANVSMIISYIVVFPMVYVGTLEGYKNLDNKLIQLADVYRVSFIKRLRYIVAPQIYPYIVSNCKIALGMCWRAGISAEVIGLTKQSIGEQMYLSKLYIMTADLLAWSAVIVAVSVIFEKIFLLLLDYIRKGLER